MSNGRNSSTAHQRGGPAESNSRSKEQPEDDRSMRPTKHARRIPDDPRNEHGGTTERSEPAHERRGPAHERCESAHSRHGATEPKARDDYRMKSPQKTDSKPRVSTKGMDNGKNNHDECERGGAKTRQHSAKSTNPSPPASRKQCTATAKAKSIVQRARTEAKPGGHSTQTASRQEADETQNAILHETLQKKRALLNSQSSQQRPAASEPTGSTKAILKPATDSTGGAERADAVDHAVECEGSTSEAEKYRNVSRSHCETHSARSPSPRHQPASLQIWNASNRYGTRPTYIYGTPRQPTDMERVQPTTGSSGCAEHDDAVVHARSCPEGKSEGTNSEEDEVRDASESRGETSSESEASDSPLPSNSVDRLTIENMDVAHWWNSEKAKRGYTKQQFKQWFGTYGWWEEWQTAKHATEEATAAVKRISEDGRTVSAMKQMMRAQMTDDDDWTSAIFRIFYIALRWRAEYLQQHGQRLRVRPAEWATYDLALEWQGTQMHVKKFLRDYHKISTTHQHQTKKKQKSVELLVCNRFTKSTHLVRSLINTGVRSNEWIPRIQQCHRKWAQKKR